MLGETSDRRTGLNTQDVAAVAATRYGLDAVHVRRLGGEYDQAFAATTASGQRSVIKVYRAEEIDSVRWQHQLLRRLTGVIPVPAVLNDRTDADVCALENGLCVAAYSWIEGTLLADIAQHPPQLLTDWGRTAAKIVNGLAGVPEPGQDGATHDWDLLAAPAAIVATLPHIVDPQHRELARAAITAFETAVAPHIAVLAKSVVHQDLNDFNVFADATGSRVVGVIDLADALYTARVCEPAIAGAYAMLRKDDPIGALAEVTRGFDQVVPLTDTEIALIYPLATIRLTVNAVTWTARRGGPTEKYGHARSQYTWQTLAALQKIPADRAEDSIRCGLEH